MQAKSSGRAGESRAQRGTLSLNLSPLLSLSLSCLEEVASEEQPSTHWTSPSATRSSPQQQPPFDFLLASAALLLLTTCARPAVLLCAQLPPAFQLDFACVCGLLGLRQLVFALSLQPLALG